LFSCRSTISGAFTAKGPGEPVLDELELELLLGAGELELELLLGAGELELELLLGAGELEVVVVVVVTSAQT
jgi:hypothetical protein